MGTHKRLLIEIHRPRRQGGPSADTAGDDRVVRALSDDFLQAFRRCQFDFDRCYLGFFVENLAGFYLHQFRVDDDRGRYLWLGCGLERRGRVDSRRNKSRESDGRSEEREVIGPSCHDTNVSPPEGSLRAEIASSSECRRLMGLSSARLDQSSFLLDRR